MATEDELRAGDPDEVGINHDLYRGAKRAPFWVLEQQPGDVNWPPHAPQPGEGAMRLWAHHAVAHGADAVLYFRWRRCRQGQEQYHAGLRKRDGSPDRGYHDAAAAAEELFDLAPVDAPVALLHDYESLWATEVQSHSPDWHYWSHLRTYYRRCEPSVQVDVVDPRTALGGYAAVVAPTLYLADDSLASHLESYVADAGHLLLGARTGEKDPANQLHGTLAPGPLADLAGLRVAQHETVPDSSPTTACYDGEAYGYQTWASWLDTEDATPLGEYTHGVADGHTAVARREDGDGSVTTCGCWPGVDLADALVTDLLTAAGVPTADRLPEGVRVAARDGYTWVTNFTDRRHTVEAPDAAWVVGGPDLGGYDAAVVAADPDTLTVRPVGD